MSTKLYTLTFFLILKSIGTSSQEITPTDKKLLAVREEVVGMIENKEIPSMAIAVIKNGELIWQEALGFTDVEANQKVSTNSIYPLGSIAKSITATGVMQLVNNNKVSLFDNVQEILKPITLKDVNGQTPKIELWQLVSNNARLNHAYGVFVETAIPESNKAKRKFIEESTVIAFPPGTNYHYSNRSFDIAELLVEQITEQSFEEYMIRHVFEPLGMTSTFTYPHRHDNQDFVSTYSSKMNTLKAETITFPAGGSSWWSSISDLTKYVQFHLGIIKNDKIISSEKLKMMHEFRQGPADLFGIGWFNDLKNQTLYSNGNVSGGNASIFINKKTNSAIITLLNRTSWDGIADQINGKINEAIAEEKNLSSNFEDWQRIYGTPYQVKYDLVGEWNGEIKEPVSKKTLQFKLQFEKDGSIRAHLEGQMIEIKNAIYNLKGNFETEFRAVLPSIYGTETKCILHLLRQGDEFVGYIQYDNDSDERFYTLPLYTKLKKT